MLDKITNLWPYSIAAMIGILIGMAVMDLIHNGKSEIVNNSPDTTYSKVKLDSIQVQIGKHDTTIYNLKFKLKDDVERSYQLDDSSAVELFKQLATQSDSIK